MVHGLSDDIALAISILNFEHEIAITVGTSH